MSESNIRTCPQCEGSGQEELYGRPKVCRKCTGSGSIPMIQRSAAIMCGDGAINKFAQSEFEDEPLGESFEEFSKGDGMDPLAFVPKDVSDNTLRLEIVSMMRGLSAESKNELFDKVLNIVGSNREEVKSSVTDEDGQMNEIKVEKFLYTTLDAIDRKKLVSVHSAIRQLV